MPDTAWKDDNTLISFEHRTGIGLHQTTPHPSKKKPLQVFILQGFIWCAIMDSNHGPRD